MLFVYHHLLILSTSNNLFNKIIATTLQVVIISFYEFFRFDQFRKSIHNAIEQYLIEEMRQPTDVVLYSRKKNMLILDSDLKGVQYKEQPTIHFDFLGFSHWFTNDRNIIVPKIAHIIQIFGAKTISSHEFKRKHRSVSKAPPLYSLCEP